MRFSMCRLICQTGVFTPTSYNSVISSYLLILTAIALFGIVENIELKNSTIYSKLRKMSTTIYLVHMYVWTIYYKIVYGGKTFGADSFFVTAIMAVVIALIGLFIDEKRNLAKEKNGNRLIKQRISKS